MVRGRIPRHVRRKLARLVQAEAVLLANRVRRGEISRADLEEAVRQTGDGEPALALELLDRWG